MITGKFVSDEKGFTLMELLIGINLAFIVLAILFSVYLFLYKFTFSASRTIEKKEEAISLLHRLEESVQKKHEFNFTTLSDGSTLILFGVTDSVLISSHTVSMRNYLTISGIDSVTLKIKPKSEELLTLLGYEARNETRIVPAKNAYSNSDLNYFLFSFTQQKKHFEIRCDVPEIAQCNFRNVEK